MNSILSYDRLTLLFDPLLRWSMRELELKRRLIDQAKIEAGQCVLDLECGTATLTILLKQLYPQAEVVGLDGDPTSANFILRQSPLPVEAGALCVRLCEQCAQECERFAADDLLQACAEVCQRCVDSCHLRADRVGGLSP